MTGFAQSCSLTLLKQKQSFKEVDELGTNSSVRHSCRSGFSTAGFLIRLAFWVGKGEKE